PACHPDLSAALVKENRLYIGRAGVNSQNIIHTDSLQSFYSSVFLYRTFLAVVSSVIKISMHPVCMAAWIASIFESPQATRITLFIFFRTSMLALRSRSVSGQLSQEPSALIGFIAISPTNPAALSTPMSSFVIWPLVHMVDRSVSSPTPMTATLHFRISSKDARMLRSFISICFVISCSTTTGAYSILLGQSSLLARLR